MPKTMTRYKVNWNREVHFILRNYESGYNCKTWLASMPTVTIENMCSMQYWISGKTHMQRHTLLKLKALRYE